jgi:hypothetical protein
MGEDKDEKPQVGIPRWLVHAFIGKLVFVTLLTIGIVWWATA